MKKQQLATFISLMLLFTFIFGAVSAQAHIEGHMPDSVAEMEYRIFLEFKPNEFETRVKLAFVLMNQDKLDDAEKEFNRSLLTSPRNFQAHLGLSQLRLKQRRTTAALETIKKSMGIEPDNPAGYLYYGLILEADSRPQEARQMYRDGLAKLAQNPKAPEAEHDRQQLEGALKNIEDKLTTIDQDN